MSLKRRILSIIEEEIAESLKEDSDDIGRTLTIEIDNTAVGEMGYSNLGDRIAEIGIKICDFSMQNKGYGKILLSMFIRSLFDDMGYQKIVLDTNLKKERSRFVAFLFLYLMLSYIASPARMLQPLLRHPLPGAYF